jgi:hypothetical protein
MLYNVKIILYHGSDPLFEINFLSTVFPYILMTQKKVGIKPATLFQFYN